MANPLRFHPLGGLGDIGRNMNVFEYGRNILIVDAGVMFPENDMLGIDLVIPNFEYLRDKKDWVRGIVITHGHEDHTGALPYLLKEIQAPIYSTRLVLALIERKLKEHFGAKLQDRPARMTPGDSVRLGPFDVHSVPLSHSIPDSMALAIDTPAGRVVHSGDFKIDFTPPGGGEPQPGPAGRPLRGRACWPCSSDSTGAETRRLHPLRKNHRTGLRQDHARSAGPGHRRQLRLAAQSPPTDHRHLAPLQSQGRHCRTLDAAEFRDRPAAGLSESAQRRACASWKPPKNCRRSR